MIRTILVAVAGSLMLLVHPPSAEAASIVTEWLDEALPDAKEVAWEPTVGARFRDRPHRHVRCVDRLRSRGRGQRDRQAPQRSGRAGQ
jgi:hypothetical protein